MFNLQYGSAKDQKKKRKGWEGVSIWSQVETQLPMQNANAFFSQFQPWPSTVLWEEQKVSLDFPSFTFQIKKKWLFNLSEH